MVSYITVINIIIWCIQFTKKLTIIDIHSSIIYGIKILYTEIKATYFHCSPLQGRALIISLLKLLSYIQGNNECKTILKLILVVY